MADRTGGTSDDAALAPAPAPVGATRFVRDESAGEAPAAVRVQAPDSAEGAKAARLERADRRRAGRALDRWDALAAVVLSLAVTGVMLWHRTALNAYDPWRYVESARFFPNDTWVPLGYTRYGLLLPIVPFTRLWGDSQAAYYAVPVIASTVLVAMTYLLGSRAFGRAGGLIAVVAFFANSHVAANYLFVYPDLPSLAVFSAALLLSFVARDRMARGAGLPVWHLLAVGFLLGWGFEIRETTMFAWPVIAWVLWRRGSVLRALAVVAVPALAWGGLDVYISSVAYGNPWLKYDVLAGQDLATVADLNTDYIGKDRSFYLTIVPRLIDRYWDGTLVFVAAGLAVLALLVRSAVARMYALWFVLLYVVYVMQGGFLDPDHPSARLATSRYWLAFFFPMALAVAGTLVLGWRAVSRRLAARPRAVVGGILVVAVVTVPIVSVARFMQSVSLFAPAGGDAFEQLRAHAAGKDLGVVWTDWPSTRVVPPYQRDPFGTERWRASEFRSLTSRSAAPPIGDRVLIVRGGICSPCSGVSAAWEAKHPGVRDGWALEWESRERNVQLFRVERVTG